MYRLVSLLSVPGKIMEQILLKTLLEHVGNEEVVGGNQQLHQGQILHESFAGFLSWGHSMAE